MLSGEQIDERLHGILTMDLISLITALGDECSLYYNRDNHCENYLVVVNDVDESLYEKCCLAPVIRTHARMGCDLGERIWFSYASGLTIQIITVEIYTRARKTWGGIWFDF